MIYKHKISLVIPCRNEETALTSLLRELPSGIDEIIVVDNGSTDKTRQVAKKMGAKVILENRADHGIGYGYAHRAGFMDATGDIIITMDGDNTYPVGAIKPAIKHLIENKLDFLSCNRFPLADDQVISWVRQLGVKVLNTEIAVLYNFRLKDALSGMWVFRSNIVDQLDLTEGGWNLSPEIKLKAITNKNIAFAEYFINHYHRLHGSSKQNIWKTGSDHAIYIFILRIKLLKNTLPSPMKYLQKGYASLLNTVASD